ncbi:MAG: EAL domain-containing protein, partial [Planctomycetota bacterium]
GTGYSSLAYLHQMPLNTLKIDRTFVSEINEADTATDGVLPDGSIVDKSRTAILRSVCSLAQTLQLELVAEGVETPLQSWFCTNLGAQLLQGYLFSKPIPADQVPAFVTRALTENTQSMRPMPMPRAA